MTISLYLFMGVILLTLVSGFIAGFAIGGYLVRPNNQRIVQEVKRMDIMQITDLVQRIEKQFKISLDTAEYDDEDI